MGSLSSRSRERRVLTDTWKISKDYVIKVSIALEKMGYLCKNSGVRKEPTKSFYKALKSSQVCLVARTYRGIII